MSMSDGNVLSYKELKGLEIEDFLIKADNYTARVAGQIEAAEKNKRDTNRAQRKTK